MFTPKVYVCVCHGCGKIHEKVSEFMSVPMSFRFPDDSEGKHWSFPCLACPDCMKLPHTSPNRKEDLNPIVRAFEDGMTSGARMRALAEFHLYQPRLLELKTRNWTPDPVVK